MILFKYSKKIVLNTKYIFAYSKICLLMILERNISIFSRQENDFCFVIISYKVIQNNHVYNW